MNIHRTPQVHLSLYIRFIIREPMWGPLGNNSTWHPSNLHTSQVMQAKAWTTANVNREPCCLPYSSPRTQQDKRSVMRSSSWSRPSPLSFSLPWDTAEVWRFLPALWEYSLRLEPPLPTLPAPSYSLELAPQQWDVPQAPLVWGLMNNRGFGYSPAVNV